MRRNRAATAKAATRLASGWKSQKGEVVRRSVRPGNRRLVVRSKGLAACVASCLHCDGVGAPSLNETRPTRTDMPEGQDVRRTDKGGESRLAILQFIN